MDTARLQATLGDPAFQRMLGRLRRRLELGGPASGTLILPEPTDEERRALAKLFGTRRTRARSVAIDLGRLEKILKDGELAPSLRAAVEMLVGPLENRRAERLALETAWSEVFLFLRARVQPSQALTAWIDDVQSSGILRRLAAQDAAQGRMLAQAASTIASRLPQPNVPLSVLAAAATGDSHSLDRGTPLGCLCVRAAARIAGMPTPMTVQARRDTWAAVGVLCDELSAPALTLNLRFGHPGSSLSVASRAHADEGEPYRLSVRQIVAYGNTLLSIVPLDVFVCENPTVLAAAAATYGSQCLPMVCLEGQPRTAARLLLRALASVGVRLHYHGDFDWGGITIANFMITEYGARPWRMQIADYLRDSGAGSVLRGRPVEACWDKLLTERMAQIRRRVHEEQLLERLLPDLQSSSAQATEQSQNPCGASPAAERLFIGRSACAGRSPHSAPPAT